MNFLKSFEKIFAYTSLMDYITDDEIKDMFNITDPSNIRDFISDMDTSITPDTNNLKTIIFNSIKQLTDLSIDIDRIITTTPEESIKKGSYATVYMDPSDNKEKIVVKMSALDGSSKDQLDQLYHLFFEAIITKIMYKISKEIPCFQSPNVYKCGMHLDNTVIIMEQIDAHPFYDKKVDPVKAIKSLANTLHILQDIVSFSHRDLHVGNCMYKNGNTCIIDYGFACISMPPYNNMSVQDLFGYYRPKLQNNLYENNMSTSLKACENKSHDLCMIILSLNETLKETNRTLKNWSKQISQGYIKEIREGYSKYTIARMIYDNKYRKGMRKYFFPNLPNIMDYTYYFLEKPLPFKYEKVLPYQWIYDMYEIQLNNFTPKVFLKEYTLKPCLKF